MKNKFLVPMFITLAFAAGALLTLLITRDTPDGNASTSRAGQTQPSNSADTGPEVTKEGKLTCLKSAEGGEQTLACAYGLEGDDGSMYGLGSQDADAFIGIGVGERIRVTGPMTEEATQYNTVGTIRATAIEKL